MKPSETPEARRDWDLERGGPSLKAPVSLLLFVGALVALKRERKIGVLRGRAYARQATESANAAVRMNFDSGTTGNAKSKSRLCVTRQLRVSWLCGIEDGLQPAHVRLRFKRRPSTHTRARLSAHREQTQGKTRARSE